ncbi:GNAT family N-acetyltransferase [Legionella bononiensis]|uniref:GNAT family N-acetyltransferase n=1 Tax=Legionella bononiensis TaxID=2793102 RepID=A0ABS1W8Y2_9GAMM|nr:GNAT family N-acetyltransferase [Legionella bononiensis]MBL7479688.1 GNAT family N-acetyltransferase [Legionella bononiensis]MBL7525800.1 GNAT family N-acetyltransferase [Legionella bononiensis]MBL7561982.1 GNAT family N-acetyltransferase [Legionella bononiensis]
MNYEIVPIREQHIKEFWSAVDSVAREHKYLAFLEGPPIETTREFVLDHINNDWPQLVALHEDKVIGWCDISPLDRPVFAHIGSLGIGVIDGYRSMGVGRALIRAALKEAQQKGLTRIELTVREQNKRAINLYKEVGFVIEGIHKNAVCINGHYENHIFMALLWC